MKDDERKLLLLAHKKLHLLLVVFYEDKVSTRHHSALFPANNDRLSALPMLRGWQAS